MSTPRENDTTSALNTDQAEVIPVESQDPTQTGLNGHDSRDSTTEDTDPNANNDTSDHTRAMAVAESLEKMQSDLGVHSSASRAILLHICQRIARLEESVQGVQEDVEQLRHDTSDGSETVRGAFSGVHDQVSTMTSKLNEYASVIEVFQKDMRTHQSHLSELSTTVKEDKEHIKVVDTKVETHHEDLNNRFVELTQKFQELPLQLAALQPPPPTIESPPFTFTTNDEKLSLESHLRRIDSSQRFKGPYTDLQPFTIPDDMKAKVEARIRQQEATKREADVKAAAELAEAYRRLQLASVNSNNPRLSELHLSLDTCQQELKRAFELIRSSNVQVYTFCESKAERMELTVLQNEIKQLRSRLRELENASHRTRQSQLQLGGDNTGSGTGSDSFMVGEKAAASKKGPQNLTNAQIPVLRVSLLELSRNLNLLKHRWKRQKRHNPNSGSNVNPVALKHLEKLVAMINDAYAVMAQEPVDLAMAEAHVEKVARVLGSDFSMQILALLGGRSDEPERCRFPVAITARAAAGEMANALCKYSEAFTDMFFRHEADNKVATAAMNEWALEKRTLENIGREVNALARSQHVLESTLAKLAMVMRKKNLGGATEGEDVLGKENEEDVLHSWSTVGSELQQLREQMEVMSKQFVTEGTLVEVLQDFKREQQSIPSTGANLGYRYQLGGSTPPVGSMSLDSLLTATSMKRTPPVDSDSSANKLAAITLEPPDDRLRSQTKLDPLQGVKLNGDVRSARHSTSHGRLDTGDIGGHGAGTASGRMHARAQMLRPKSVQRDRLG